MDNFSYWLFRSLNNKGKINSETITQYIISVLIHKWFYAPFDGPVDELVNIKLEKSIETKGLEQKKSKEAISLFEKKLKKAQSFR